MNTNRILSLGIIVVSIGIILVSLALLTGCGPYDATQCDQYRDYAQKDVPARCISYFNDQQDTSR